MAAQTLIVCCVLAMSLLQAASGECVDKDPKCAKYEKGFCTNSKYKPFAKDNCQLFCGYCPSASGECVDKDPKCAKYEKGFCTNSKYKPFAKDNCQLFCGYCPCEQNGVIYKHGEDIPKVCGRSTCNNRGIESVPFSCYPKFDLPNPSCHWMRPETHCCRIPVCPPGIKIELPAWWSKYEQQIRKKQIGK